MSKSLRLSRQILSDLPPRVVRPRFDLARLATGIVHLGIGAFARAHLASYTQPLLAADPRWGILGVSLRRPDARDALAPQDWLYTKAERDGAGEHLEVMAALTGITVGGDAALEALTGPSVRIVTLTVTEKGYHRDPASGALLDADPDVQRDLASPGAPATVPGLLAEAVRRRRQAGLRPFTVLSCDNLPSNGEALRRVVVEFAARIDPGLGHFIEDSVAFPCCMVDRIVPATTDADRARITEGLGAFDAWPVVCEPFSQWAIEDHFPNGRPVWETAGAELVKDVRPFEDMKLRILNGSHSSIAYLAQLAGWPTVAKAIQQPELAAHIEALMREIATTLHAPIDPNQYRAALMARFANPALRHRTAQIAMDGSQKLPQRLFAPALDRLACGEPIPRIALGVAAWLRFLRGTSDDGAPLPLDDPMARRLRSAAASATDTPSLLDAIFAISDIVPPPLAASAEFRNTVLMALDSLTVRGASATLALWNEKYVT